MKKEQANGSILLIILRVLAILLIIATVIPALNPVRMSGLIRKDYAFVSMVLSYSSVISGFSRALKRGWIDKSILDTIYAISLAVGLGIITIAVGCCMTLGNKKMQRLGAKIIAIVSGLSIPIISITIYVYRQFCQTSNPDKIEPMFAKGFWVFVVLLAGCCIVGFINVAKIPKPSLVDKYEMESKYRLFLMILPFVILCFVFSYLPLWGWRYAFFDYKPGQQLSRDNFVGFKWFTFLFRNPATRSDIIRVLKNTLAMSGLGIVTSWLPMAFAIFLAEIRAGKFRKIVQTVTTIPNFISWVLVYSFAFALFSTEGFVNSILIDLGIIKEGTNFLMSGKHIWLKMWAWGTWKGLGWNAIIYISGINSIDPQLYEAATIDGAGRFKRMWYVTVPGLTPTFFVLLLLSIAGILSNGMDQYFVFKNAANKDTIEVLDLYVYTLGLGSGGSGNIPLATVVGMLKSIISIILLFGANRISKLVRGESII